MPDASAELGLAFHLLCLSVGVLWPLCVGVKVTGAANFFNWETRDALPRVQEKLNDSELKGQRKNLAFRSEMPKMMAFMKTRRKKRFFSVEDD